MAGLPPRPPSPAGYRQSRYSPSRQVSPPPPISSVAPRAGLPNRQHWSPPPPDRRDTPRKYDSPPPRGRFDNYGYARDRSPPPRARYDSPPPRDRYRSPSKGRYGSPPRRPDYRRSMSPPPRRYSPSPPSRRYHSPPHRDGHTRSREHSPPRRGMEADREQARIDSRPVGAPRGPAAHNSQWERGRDVDELDVSLPQTYGSTSLAARGSGPSPASREVVFIGLDEELNETDLTSYLRAEHRAMIDSTKLVHKRFADTGRVNVIGFVTFASLSEAEHFVSDNYPSIVMPALYANSESKKVRIDFATPHAVAPVVSDPPPPFQQPQRVGHVPHDGMRDVGTPGGGNRVLLLRQVDPDTASYTVIKRIAEEIGRLVGSAGQVKKAETAIDRLVTIVDRAGGWSWGICFVELATAELAQALLPHLISPQTQPSGFRIAGVPVAVSFASPASFVEAQVGLLGSEHVVQSASRGGIGGFASEKQDGSWCAYWHAQGGASQATPNGKTWTPGLEISSETRTFLGPLAGAAPAAALTPNDAEAAGLPNLTGAVLQPIKLGGAGTGKKRKEEEMMVPLVVKNVLTEAEEEPESDTVLRSRAKGNMFITPQSGRKVANNISKWNNKQVELAKPVDVAKTKPPTMGFSSVNAVPVAAKTRAAPESSTREEGYDFADTSTLPTTGKCACLLCQRQFKSEEILRKHVAQSELHKTNLLNPETVEAGKRRKEAVGKSTTSRGDGNGNVVSDAQAAQAAGVSESEYRDRAAERRKAFNQPEKPSWHEMQALASSEHKKRRFEGPGAPPPPPPEPVPAPPPGTDETNVGNQLLAKMGWKAGTGLGVGEEGRVDPIKVQQFANRAGLGAGVGVEVGAANASGSGSCSGRTQMGRDMAQARYNASSDSR